MVDWPDADCPLSACTLGEDHQGQHTPKPQSSGHSDKDWESKDPGRIANALGLSFNCYQEQHRGCNTGHFAPGMRCECVCHMAPIVDTYHEDKLEDPLGGSFHIVRLTQHAHTLHFLCLWAAQFIQHFGHGHFGAF